MTRPGDPERYWQHSGFDQIDEDHPAVPAFLHEIEMAPRCDFCLADGAEWVLPVREFRLTPTDVSSPDWMACGECVNYLRHDNWKGLVTRSLRHHLKRHPERGPEGQAFARDAIAYQYEMVAKNVTGKPRRVEPRR